MKANASALLGAVLATTTTVATADDVTGLRSEKLVEQSHTITMTLSPGFAKMVVRRTVFNGGERHDQASFDIDVPAGAVATGLRTLGALNGAAKWFDGELMEAEAAAEKYKELTGIGGYYPKDPALLSWRAQDHLELQVFPCAPNEPKTIEYTFTVPTEYREGRHHFKVPFMGTEKLPAALTVRASPGQGTIYVDDTRLVSNKAIPLDKEIDVALAPRRFDLLEGAAASVHVDDDTTLAHFRIEAAPELSTVPRGAHIVVVLDHSRSLDVDTATAQLAAAQSYLSHFTDARVQVMSFDRAVHAHHPRFVSVKRAIDDLAKMKVTLKNGSDVSAALLAAESVLAKVAKNRPKRILLMTDSRVDSLTDEDTIRASIGTTNAIVHFGRVRVSSAPELTVDDSHSWSNAVRSTGGLSWVLAAPTMKDDALKAAVLDWARPTRLRKLTIGLPHSPLYNGGLDISELEEGEGFSQVWLQGRALPYVKVEGELWAKPVREVLRPDDATGDRWSALAFGTEVLDMLSEPEMTVLAQRGQAVSPVTSFLAVEPGVRPSTEGIGTGEGIGLGSIGTIGHGSGTGHGVGVGTAFDHDSFLQDKLRPAFASCGATDDVGVTVETTLAEVVLARDLSPSAAEAGLAACLTEAVWSLVLPSAFNQPSSVFRLTVSQK